MPLWTIYHSADTFTVGERRELAEAITDYYADVVGLPRFYVVVIFRELPTDDFYVGGRPTGSAARVTIDHIARRAPDSVTRRRMTTRLSGLLTPLMEKHPEVHWEFHIDETSEELWMINGLVPPPAGSDAEKAWAAANAASPY
ncbi:tautomerase family protein [Streptomyces sp. NPDC002514]|uniref:tautomerase family protein n=1 Tax=Streptomyces sp. NPDC001270 TaxID=3364554 RepID=UPI003676FF44